MDLVAGIGDALLDRSFMTRQRGSETGSRYFRARLTGDREERWAVYEMYLVELNERKLLPLSRTENRTTACSAGGNPCGRLAAYPAHRKTFTTYLSPALTLCHLNFRHISLCLLI